MAFSSEFEAFPFLNEIRFQVFILHIAIAPEGNCWCLEAI